MTPYVFFVPTVLSVTIPAVGGADAGVALLDAGVELVVVVVVALDVERFVDGGAELEALLDAVDDGAEPESPSSEHPEDVATTAADATKSTATRLTTAFMGFFLRSRRCRQ